MKPKKRLPLKNHGVLKNKKKRMLLQQRCRSTVYFTLTEPKKETIDWQLI